MDDASAIYEAYQAIEEVRRKVAESATYDPDVQALLDRAAELLQAVVVRPRGIGALG